MVTDKVELCIKNLERISRIAQRNLISNKCISRARFIKLRLSSSSFTHCRNKFFVIFNCVGILKFCANNVLLIIFLSLAIFIAGALIFTLRIISGQGVGFLNFFIRCFVGFVSRSVDFGCSFFDIATGIFNILGRSCYLCSIVIVCRNHITGLRLRSDIAFNSLNRSRINTVKLLDYLADFCTSIK